MRHLTGNRKHRLFFLAFYGFLLVLIAGFFLFMIPMSAVDTVPVETVVNMAADQSKTMDSAPGFISFVPDSENLPEKVRSNREKINELAAQLMRAMKEYQKNRDGMKMQERRNTLRVLDQLYADLSRELKKQTDIKPSALSGILAVLYVSDADSYGLYPVVLVKKGSEDLNITNKMFDRLSGYYPWRLDEAVDAQDWNSAARITSRLEAIQLDYWKDENPGQPIPRQMMWESFNRRTAMWQKCYKDMEAIMHTTQDYWSLQFEMLTHPRRYR